MRIVFTGGGTGGHFYPLIAVAEQVRRLARDERLVEPELFFLAPDPYSPGALFDHGIKFRRVPAGKMRRYFSPANVLDWIKIAWGCLVALVEVFKIFPDVVFSKGGYGAFPIVFAARVLRIPVVVHESDSRPGRVNAWAGRFAARVAVSYAETAKFFPEGKTAWTGQPVRRAIEAPAREGAREHLRLESHTPTILVLGGSQGAQAINRAVVGALRELVADFQVIHQTGKANFEETKALAGVELGDSPLAARYLPFDYLDDLAMRMAAGAADLVVTRAGSSLFEIASWGLPSIVIPIPESVSHDQRTNAYAYARGGAAVVLEEGNLTKDVFLAEIRRILNSEPLQREMALSAKKFAKPDADAAIAREIVQIAIAHEEA
jgi:UDP-N-acetylglucosamine--N-acetylmuramyl-(pentapeptide) pyrophosphoryl-undecaprenol N-acetylglucosamine transferase